MKTLTTKNKFRKESPMEKEKETLDENITEETNNEVSTKERFEEIAKKWG